MIPEIKKMHGRWRSIIVSFFLLLVVLYLLNGKLGAVVSDLNKIDLNEWFFVIGICTLNNLVTCLRFFLIARVEISKNINSYDVFRVTYAGIFLAYWMPFSILGDGARAWWLRNNVDCSYPRAVITVILDRVVALFSLLAFMIPFIPKYLGGLAGYYLKSTTLIGALVVFIFGVYFFVFKGRFARILHEILAIYKRHANHKTLWVQLAVGLAYVLSYFFAILLIVSYLGLSDRISPLGILTYTPLIFLIQNVPVAFGGTGTRELAFIAFLGSEIGDPSAVAISLILGVSFLIAALPGIVFLSIFKRKAA